MTQESVLSTLPSSHSSPVSFVPLPQVPGDVQSHVPHVQAMVSSPADVLSFGVHSRRCFCSGVGQKWPQTFTQSSLVPQLFPGAFVQCPAEQVPRSGHCPVVSQPVVRFGLSLSLQYPLNSWNPPSHFSLPL